ncbi:putative peptidase family m13 protein [Phaeomoniella chlamydospora]|uniref:Putative peptidase family m13 protein n=1 Tax=Phaeomoniella chlamydospora TaxID=158046 RepID=A0A0G2E4U6_PHACM|nr:putative peptidase family m13 protein [Phaeomoniella chlamydospora]
MDTPMDSAGQSTPDQPGSGAESRAQGRPKASRHSSSWVNRIHRRHDKIRHSGSLPEEEPLLREQRESDDQPSLEEHQQQDPENAVKHKKQTHHDEICLTPACVHAASELLYQVDPDYEQIDPCDDFDQYACGGWQQRHDLRPDQSSVSTAMLMDESSRTVLRHILEDSSFLNNITDLEYADASKENFHKLKASYDACMNVDLLKEIGLAPLAAFLKSIDQKFIAGNGPRLASAAPELRQRLLRSNINANLTDVVQSLSSTGVDALVTFYVSADDRDPDNNILTISPPSSPGLPSLEYYDDDDIVSDYTKVIANVLKYFSNSTSSLFTTTYGDGTDLQGFDALVNSLVEFERKLAKVTPTTQQQEDVTYYYNPRSIDEAQEMFPQLSFSDIISTLSLDKSVPQKVIVGSPSYMRNASRILEDTHEEIVHAFLTWKVIQSYSGIVDDAAVKTLKQFNKRLRGQDPDAEPERWKTCIGTVDSQLGWILSNYFVDATFSEESKKFGERIISDIKTSFVNTLNKTSWMSASVREQAINKVAAIDVKVGYPTSDPNITDPAALSNYYSDLAISNTSYFNNTVHSTAFEIRRMWAKLGKPVSREEWDMTAPTVNAYYDLPGQSINFPAGIMQSPVFHPPSVPQYLAYGSFGSVSGHELSHAFDSTGRHYDQNGNFTDWWDNSTVNQFQTKAQCFIDQYSNFTVPGNNGEELNLNGRLTLGENIADAGGVAASFAAWKRHELSDPDQLLPGLGHFTKDQLFFVSYASFWCGKTRKEAQVEAIYRDPHAPRFARIKGTMANSREFKEAFGCKKKEEVCKLW